MNPKHLLGEKSSLWVERLARAQAVALFSDFDGTLTPIVSRPRHSSLARSMRNALRRLCRQPDVFVAVVSGRPVESLRSLVRLHRCAYIGVHGLEVAWPGQRVVSHASEADRGRVAAARKELASAVVGFPGVWVEPKAACVAVHYRQASASAVPRVESAVRRVVAAHAGRLTALKSSKAFELLPSRGINKATAVATMLKKLSNWFGRAPLPIYLGDDAGDEIVFRSLRARGLTVVVGWPRPNDETGTTAAGFFLADPGEVRGFFQRLLLLRGKKR